MRMIMRMTEMLQGRLVLAYTLLVGIPVLLLLGALEAGRGLTAPPAIAGEWTLDFVDQPAIAGNCYAALLSLRQATLSISQSGTTVLVHVDDPRSTTFRCELQAGSLVSEPVPVSRGGCGGETALRMEAQVVGKPDRRFLQGGFSLIGCESCAPVQFRAVRRGVPGRRG